MRVPSRLLCRALLLIACVGASGALAAVTEGTVPSADGVPIHYTVSGEGRPALLFIHGWSCDGTYWDGQVAAFAPKYRVVTVDLAGHGRSGRDRAAWTIEAFGQDVRAVVEQLGLDRVVLIGHSMGGNVALAAAGLLPGRVVAVIGVDTLQDAERVITPEMLAPLVAGMQADFPAVTKQFVAQMFPVGADSALVARVAGRMASAPPAIAIPVFQGIFAYDLKAGFAGVKAPIREINSDRNPTNFAGNRKYAPDFDAVILAGVGHFPQLERPAEFDAALAKVVAEVTK
ncbi:MAG: alpha/beta fold hydrolase [Candidatus Krumholzibacteriia bacterium]